MTFWIYDKHLVKQYYLDVYMSAVWAVRWSEAGEFEITMPFGDEAAQYVKQGYYITCNDDANIFDTKHRYEGPRIMRIDTLVAAYEDHVKTITISGRSVEYILDRRVFVNVSPGSSMYDLYTLLKVGLPSGGSASNRILIDSVTIDDDGILWSSVEELGLLDGLQGRDAYSLYSTLCKNYKKGLVVRFSGEQSDITAIIMDPCDRSRNNSSNRPPIVFSTKFENIRSTKSLKSDIDFKTTIYTTAKQRVADPAGESSYRDAFYSIFVGDEASGYDRREIYQNVELVKHEEEKDGILYEIELSDDEVYDQMIASSEKQLKTTVVTEAFDGDVENRIQYTYGEDYYLGDIVELEDPYGNSKKVILSEMCISSDANGDVYTPTFVIYEEESL